METLAVPALATPLDAYAPRDFATGCDYPHETPGARAFRDWVLAHVGGRDAGIARKCPVGGASEHKEGRAWDWGVSADDPTEKAMADGLVGWLLAPDPASGEPHAMFRRLGLFYFIWDGQVWSSRTKSFQPYTGADPHRSHVHFSFGWPGALGQTSGYRWLAPGLVPVSTPPVLGGGSAAEPPLPLGALALGFAAGYAAVHFWPRRRVRT